ncbi:hypothetical protein PX699_03690 [Sphingobium sp. H39-3-25]|uniref:hypothetical protein n=1 Tax=Sphingobium arseniciresistens TaxID=3030834 RepID=UPI0023B9B5AA|nr:hypothetical protein [Sphingobium arseniciresistens]
MSTYNSPDYVDEARLLCFANAPERYSNHVLSLGNPDGDPGCEYNERNDAAATVPDLPSLNVYTAL